MGGKHALFRIHDLPEDIGDAVATYLEKNDTEFMADLTEHPIVVESLSHGQAFVIYPKIARVDLSEFMSLIGGDGE